MCTASDTFTDASWHTDVMAHVHHLYGVCDQCALPVAPLLLSAYMLTEYSKWPFTLKMNSAAELCR